MCAKCGEGTEELRVSIKRDSFELRGWTGNGCRGVAGIQRRYDILAGGSGCIGNPSRRRTTFHRGLDFADYIDKYRFGSEFGRIPRQGGWRTA